MRGVNSLLGLWQHVARWAPGGTPALLCHPTPCVGGSPGHPPLELCCVPRTWGGMGTAAVGQPVSGCARAPLPRHQSGRVSRYPCFCQQSWAPHLLINMHSPGINGKEMKPLFVFISVCSHLKILMLTFARLLFKLMETCMIHKNKGKNNFQLGVPRSKSFTCPDSLSFHFGVFSPLGSSVCPAFNLKDYWR